MNKIRWSGSAGPGPALSHKRQSTLMPKRMLVMCVADGVFIQYSTPTLHTSREPIHCQNNQLVLAVQQYIQYDLSCYQSFKGGMLLCCVFHITIITVFGRKLGLEL